MHLIRVYDGLPGPWGAELDILRREAVPVGLSLLGLATLEGLRKANSPRIKHHDFRRRVLKIKSVSARSVVAVQQPQTDRYFNSETAGRQGWEEAMPEFDRDALKRSIQALRTGNPARHRTLTGRSPQPELSAIDSQLRKESLETLESALTEAGVDMRKLRATLARDQTKALDRVAALRPRAEAPKHSETGAAAGSSNRFRSLQALAGHAVPLDRPSSLTFLTEPVNITANEVGGSYLVASSLTPAFVQTMVDATSADHSGEYTFWYNWNNDSDSSVLAQVSTALEFNGNIYAQASTFCGEASSDTYIDGGLNIGFTPNNLLAESRTYHFATLGAKATYFVIDTKTKYFDNVDNGLSIDGFIVPPNTELVISVWVEFSFNFTADGVRDFNAGSADFASDGNSVAVPGVALITSPIQVIIQ